MEFDHLAAKNVHYSYSNIDILRDSSNFTGNISKTIFAKGMSIRIRFA